MKRLFASFTAFSCRRPWPVLAVIALITVAAVVGALRIEMEFSQRSMLPQGYPSISTLSRVEEEFGGIKYLKVLLRGDLTSPEGALALYEFQRELEEGEASDLHGAYVLRVDHYLTYLVRNPQARALFDLRSGLGRSESGEEWSRVLEGFLASGEAKQLRADPETEPLFRILDEAAGSQPSEPLRSQVESILDLALREAVSRYLATVREGLVVGRSLSGDGHTALVNVQVRADLSQPEDFRYAGRLEDFTRSFFDRHGLEVEVSGETYIMKDIQRIIMKDSAILGAVALAFMVLVIFLTFRKVLDVALTIGVVLISTLWVFGLMGWAGMKYGIMTIAVVPLMLGIDIAYSIHVLNRYYEEREKGRDAAGSAVGSVATVGVAVFLAAATTMFGFLSFFITDLPPMREFGAVCLAGVFFGFLLSVTLLPAALTIRDRRRGRVERSRREKHYVLGWLDRGLASLSLLAERHRRLVWVACAILLAGSALLASGLSTSADFRTFVPRDMPSYSAMTRVEEEFGGQDVAVALVEGEDVLSPEALRRVQDFIQEVLDHPRNAAAGGEGRYFRADKTSSLPGILTAVSGSLPSSREEARSALAMAEEEYGFDASSLLSADGTRTLVVFEVPFVEEKGEEEMSTILREAARKWEGEASLSIQVTGTPLIVSDTLGRLFTTQVKTAFLALLLCVFLVVLVFRSLAYGLSATSVVFLGMVLELGVLRLIGWPLDIMTVMIASLVIGAGIDFGIHVAHRFREEIHQGGMSPEDAVNATVRNVGNALVSAAVTTCGAFLILAISSLSPLRRFGIITALALACSCFAALVVEPAFLTTVAVWKRRRKAAKEGG